MTGYRSDSIIGLPLDEALRMHAVAWGMTYPGEVVRVERWAPRWSSNLSPNLCFRVVVLPHDQPSPASSELTDDRIAVLRIHSSPLAVREVAPPYPAARDTLSSPTDEDLVIASGRPWSAELQAHARNLHPSDSLRSFLDALIPALYPRPPIDLSRVPEPLDEDHVALIWQGLASPTARLVARSTLRYTSALELDADSPGPGSVVEVIVGSAQSAGPGGIPLANLWSRLLRELSLPPYLTTLYALVIVLRARSSLEFVLASNARVPLLRGRVHAEERLTTHLLPGVGWTEDWRHDVETMSRAGPATWRSVQPYLQLLLGETDVPDDEEMLVERLRSRRSEVAEAILEVRALVETPGLAPSASQTLQPLAVLERVVTVLEADTPDGLATRTEATFHSIVEMAEVIDAQHGIESLSQAGAAIREAWRYLQDAVPIEEDRELHLDRQVIRDRMALGTLWAAPALWPGVEEAFLSFRSRYVHRYVEYHEELARALSELHRRLGEAEPSVAALRRLNAIGSLGDPLEPGLADEHASLVRTTTPCEERSLASLLQRTARCPLCSMALGTRPPTEQVESLLRRLDRAIKEQRRRLGSQAVRRILTRGGLDQLDRFLQAVQASDVASLTTLLDDNLVAFIERLLQGSTVRSPRRSLFERLQERFPSVSPGEVNVVAAEFARLIRQELEEAERRDPSRPTRIALW